MRNRHRRVQGSALSERRRLSGPNQLFQMLLLYRLHRLQMPDQYRRLRLEPLQERWNLPRLYRRIHLRMPSRIHRYVSCCINNNLFVFNQKDKNEVKNSLRFILRDEHKRLSLLALSTWRVYRRRKLLYLHVPSWVHGSPVSHTDKRV